MNEKEDFECGWRAEPAKVLQKPSVCLRLHDDVVPYGAIELDLSDKDTDYPGEK